MLKAALVVLLAVGVFIPLAYWAYASHPVSPAERDKNAQRFVKAEECRPEPGERAAFLYGVLCLPAAILGWTFALRSLDRRWPLRITGPWRIALEMIGAGLLAGLCWWAVWGDDYFHVHRNLFFKHPATTLPLLLLSAAALRFHVGDCRLVRGGLSLAALALVVVTALTCVFDEDTPYSANWHFTAVLSSVVQVQSGKALLINCRAQYGLYAQLLQPLFAVWGLTVLKFTTLMGVLVAASYTALWLTLRQACRSRLTAFFAFAALVFATWYFLRIPIGGVYQWIDPYFQYVPIRFVFPAALVGLAWTYFRRPRRWAYWGITAFLSVGVLWNFDGGLPALLTWLAVLCFGELTRPTWWEKGRRIAGHLTAGAVVFAGVVGLYTAAVYLAYGAAPHYSQLFRYQRLFYLSGFFMLPMKPAGTWVLVILVYLAGLAYAASALASGTVTVRVKLVLLLSVLGIGLFSYYQGRSHHFVLTLVWWPAFVLLGLFLDELVGRIRDRAGRPLDYSLALLIGWTLAGFTWAALDDWKCMRAWIAQQLNPASHSLKEGVQAEADWLRRVADPDEGMVILSPREALLHVAAGVRPAAPCSFIEMVTLDDYQAVWRLLDRHPGVKVYVEQSLFNQKQDPVCGRGLIDLLVDRCELCEVTPAGYIFQKGSPVLLGPGPPACHAIFKDGNHPNGLACPEVEFGRSFTLELVVRPARIPDPHRILLSNHCGSLKFQGLAIQECRPNVFELTFGDGRCWNRVVEVPLEPERWSYLALVVADRNVQAFVNGKLVAWRDLGDLVLKESDCPLRIGNWLNGDWPFVGLIQESRFLDYALPSAVIQQNAERVRQRLQTDTESPGSGGSLRSEAW